jgi:hypothetical protein
MTRKTAAGILYGFLLAAFLTGMVGIPVLMANGASGVPSDMTKIGEMRTKTQMAMPGKVCDEGIVFDVQSISVLWSKLDVSKVNHKGETIDIAKYYDEVVNAVNSGGLRLTMTINTDGLELPLTKDAWVNATIKGTFSMTDFSCDLAHETVVHLIPGFNVDYFGLKADANDKAGVGYESGEILGVSTRDAALRALAYSVSAVAQTNVEVHAVAGIQEGTNSLYLRGAEPVTKPVEPIEF